MSTKPPAAERCYKLVTHNGTPHWECRFCSVFNSGKRGIRRFDVEKVKKSSGNLWRHIEKQHPQHYVAPPSRTSDVSTLETCSDITSIASCVVKQNAEGIIRGFAASKEDRQKLESHQKVDGVEKPKVIIKSVETRWNSFLAACIRMLQLKKWVQSCFEQTEEFWKELQLLIAFLKPFQVATDVVQRDASTLFDVF